MQEEENPFMKVMEKHSNEKLIYILTTDKDGFQPKALEAAKIVLDSRGLSEVEKLEVSEKIRAKEKKETAERTEHRSLLKGPGIIVTIGILLPLMLLTPDRSFMVTMLFAVIGFGAGHLVNYLYFKAKDDKTKNSSDILD